MTAYEPKPYDIAGVDLYGERQDDGSIKLGSKPRFTADDRTHLPTFPEEVRVAGVTYTLEDIKENDWPGRAELEKTSPDDPRLRICWGVYV